MHASLDNYLTLQRLSDAQAQARDDKGDQTNNSSGQSWGVTVTTPWSSLEAGEVLTLATAPSQGSQGSSHDKAGSQLTWKLSDIEIQNMRTLEKLEDIKK